MIDALSAEKCIAVKPLLSHLAEEVLVAEDNGTNLKKEMKKRIKDDLEARHDDPEFTFLLDPRFKLNYVTNRAEILEEVEMQMRELTNSSVDIASHWLTSSESGNSGMAAPPIKKAKELSKVPGQKSVCSTKPSPAS